MHRCLSLGMRCQYADRSLREPNQGRSASATQESQTAALRPCVGERGVNHAVCDVPRSSSNAAPSICPTPSTPLPRTQESKC